MSDGTTYDARVYQTEVYKGRRVTTYWVRWKVGRKLWKEAFRTAAQADSFRSALLTAARKGETFSLATGRPTAWKREKAEATWYEFAYTYLDMKWKQASAKCRKDIARALTAATPVMLLEARGRPDDASIRRALVRWDSTPSSAPTRPMRSPRCWPGSPATACPCRHWPSLRPLAGCSTRQPADWTARTQPLVSRAGSAPSWPTPWTTPSNLACSSQTRSG
jgi:hypothetical protein